MTKKTTLKISGMHCISCAMNIDGELEDAGAKSAKTSYAKQETEIEFDDDKIKLDELIKTIKNTGYQAQVKE